MDLQNVWLKYGLIFGAVSIVFQLIMYYVLPMGMWTQMFVGLAIMVVVFVMVGKEKKAENGGYLSYGEALKVTFLTGLIGTFVSGLFSLILINLVDPTLADKLAEMAIESTKSMMESFGAPEEAMDEALEKIESEMGNQFTPMGQIKNILTSSATMVIPAAIVSIFLRKERDLNAPPQMDSLTKDELA